MLRWRVLAATVVQILVMVGVPLALAALFVALDGLVVLLLGRGWSVAAIEGVALVNALLSALALAWLARRPWPFRGAPPVRSS